MVTVMRPIIVVIDNNFIARIVNHRLIVLGRIIVLVIRIASIVAPIGIVDIVPIVGAIVAGDAVIGIPIAVIVQREVLICYSVLINRIDIASGIASDFIGVAVFIGKIYSAIVFDQAESSMPRNCDFRRGRRRLIHHDIGLKRRGCVLN
jgi:hypothetical protein